MNDIIVFTDGSTLNNQEKGNRKGGVGVFFGESDDRNISLPLKETSELKVTNQVAELMAPICAIEKILSSQKLLNSKIVIYTDSMYVRNIVHLWADNWEKKNWLKSDKKPVDNIVLVKKLYYLSKNVNVEFRHCKSHQKEPKKEDENYFIWYGNNQADKLAVTATELI